MKNTQGTQIIHDGSLIPLDLVKGYPVSWSLCKVCVDLVQNFYDSIGARDFDRDFHWEVRAAGQSTLRMWTEGRPFSYEWLTLIGGSTKTGFRGYAGMYGEGFKICALVLSRDFHADVMMRSAGWALETEYYQKEINGKAETMLGFRYHRHEDDGVTELTVKLEKPMWVLEDVMHEALCHFAYDGNPLFGKKLADNYICTVYERSAEPVPGTTGSPEDGVFYFQNIARGRMEYPLVIVAKRLQDINPDREREQFGKYTTELYVHMCLGQLDSSASLAVLMRLEGWWECIYKAGRQAENIPYYTVCALVRHVAQNPENVLAFRRLYAGRHMAYIERKLSDPERNKIIREAENWVRTHPEYQGMEMVNPIFRLLGAESVVDEYAKVRDNICREPLGVEAARCRILAELLSVAFPDFGLDGTEIVLSADGKPVDVMQYTRRCRCLGRPYKRYQIDRIVLLPEDMGDSSFEEALLKCVEACCHVIGGKRSASMNAFLTLQAGIFLDGRRAVEAARRQWREAGKDAGW